VSTVTVALTQLLSQMGTSQHTSYVEDADTRRVADAMASLLYREGLQQIAEHGRLRESAPLAIGVVPGATGWTIIKTVPLEMLGRRAPHANRMRLVDLAGLLGTAALQINLYQKAFRWTANYVVCCPGTARGPLAIPIRCNSTRKPLRKTALMFASSYCLCSNLSGKARVTNTPDQP